MNRLLPCVLLALFLSGCSVLRQDDPPQVSLVGLQPLPGEGMELRFAARLRIQNPNEQAIDYRGLSLRLEVNDQPLASGVSDASGTLPGFGEQVLSVPMSISGLSMLRQGWQLGAQAPAQGLPYRLTGKLAAGPLNAVRFEERGTLDWDALR